jgi:hypothetical protein
MWSDNESDVDLLQYRYLASAVTRIATDRDLTPSTVGLFGDWGSGKSTLLRMVEEQLKKKDAVLCLTFNGWLFEGYDDAKTVLMGAVLDGIEEMIASKESVPEKAQGLLKKLAARVNWLHLIAMAGAGAATTFLGYPEAAPGAAAVAGKATKPEAPKKEHEQKALSAEDVEKIARAAPDGADNVRRSIRDFRRDFETLLSEAGIKTLVVFIDDLDRCTPDTIIETLEAIKLFLFVQGSAFVLAVDPRIVQYAVRMRFPELPGEEAQVGRDYLEKLIQFPVSVPPLSAAEIESYMNLLFAKKRLARADFQTTCEHIEAFRAKDVADHAFDVSVCRELLKGRAVPGTLEEDFDLVLQIAPVLTRGLSGSPRRTKRFLNALLFRLGLAEDRGLALARPVLAKLMLLEYFRDEYFRQLARLQAEQSGRPSELVTAEEHLRRVAAATEDTQPAEEGDTAPRKASDARSKVKPAKEVKAPPAAMPPEVETWLGDPWMEEWLRSDPPMRDVNLQPYFYIAREKVGDLDSPLRLSPHAVEVLKRLMEGGVSQNLALNETKNLAEADATGIFQHLSQRIRKAQTLDATSMQPLLFKLMQYRPELVPQLIALYALLPETKITLGTPSTFWQAVKGSGHDAAASTLLRRWASSQRTTLAGAAKQVVKRAEEQK